MALFLPGYTGTIWTALRTGLTYTSTILNPSNPISNIAIVNAVASSLKNGLNAIETNLYSTASSQNYINLAPVEAMGLTLDAVTQAFLVSRTAALQAASLSVAALAVAPVTNTIPQTLLGGTPIIPDPGFLEWMMNFGFETPPAGLTPSNFVAQAQAAATAWVTIASTMQTQGVVYNGSSLNVVNQMGYAAQVTANALENMAPLPSGTNNLKQAWNQLVVVPTLGRLASLVYNNPTSLVSQNTSVIRYVILNTLNQFNQLIIALRQGSLQNIKLATVLQGDSLMDIAARELGDFEQWYSIAQINMLVPPFISSIPGPGVASPGQQLFLPTSTVTTAVGQAPDYQINYLGCDIYYGPLNSDMMAWTGDFQVISGYQNLSFSLGRRLQTTIGTLIYHLEFGSRIPPEIGSIASSSESAHISAFTQSALLSDPRVNKIVSVNVTTQPNSALAVNSTVLPNGIGAAQVTVNQVLGPA